MSTNDICYYLHKSTQSSRIVKVIKHVSKILAFIKVGCLSQDFARQHHILLIFLLNFVNGERVNNLNQAFYVSKRVLILKNELLIKCKRYVCF